MPADASPKGGRLVRRFAYQSALALVWASLWESYGIGQLITGFLVATVLVDGFTYLTEREYTRN